MKPTRYCDLKVGDLFLFLGDDKVYVKAVRDNYQPLGLWDFKAPGGTIRFLSSLAGTLSPPVDTSCHVLQLSINN